MTCKKPLHPVVGRLKVPRRLVRCTRKRRRAPRKDRAKVHKLRPRLAERPRHKRRRVQLIAHQRNHLRDRRQINRPQHGHELERKRPHLVRPPLPLCRRLLRLAILVIVIVIVAAAACIARTTASLARTVGFLRPALGRRSLLALLASSPALAAFLGLLLIPALLASIRVVAVIVAVLLAALLGRVVVIIIVVVRSSSAFPPAPKPRRLPLRLVVRVLVTVGIALCLGAVLVVVVAVRIALPITAVLFILLVVVAASIIAVVLVILVAVPLRRRVRSLAPAILVPASPKPRLLLLQLARLAVLGPAAASAATRAPRGLRRRTFVVRVELPLLLLACKLACAAPLFARGHLGLVELVLLVPVFLVAGDDFLKHREPRQLHAHGLGDSGRLAALLKQVLQNLLAEADLCAAVVQIASDLGVAVLRALGGHLDQFRSHVLLGNAIEQRKVVLERNPIAVVHKRCKRVHVTNQAPSAAPHHVGALEVESERLGRRGQEVFPCVRVLNVLDNGDIWKFPRKQIGKPLGLGKERIVCRRSNIVQHGPFFFWCIYVQHCLLLLRSWCR
eukprot:comp21841_c0_seq1/m.49335 comp21841_c0_seq1/g.49335  ORF comp21841_c0_seq1/g.49335 comp21841_c0_seq1/m.49335 type:complete len:561 (-) comp21841_c0_seq1:67-1749(-)